MAVKRALVVEDAPEFARLVEGLLVNLGYAVRAVGSVAGARSALADDEPVDLVVLDLSLPDGDGLDLCRVIRERSDAYVLILSGRDDEVDKVLGLRLGADDYVTKPFSVRELEARIDALARRPRTSVRQGGERAFSGFVLRPLAREFEVDGVPIELTRLEFDLLDVLSSAPQQVFTRVQLLERLRGEQWFGDEHVVDVHIANLRKKVRAISERPIVRTVRGVGYGLAT
jgi:DNA-binding response OmpR family regulator